MAWVIGVTNLLLNIIIMRSIVLLCAEISSQFYAFVNKLVGVYM